MTDFTDPFGSNTIVPSREAYVSYSLTTSEELFWPFNYVASNGLLAAAIIQFTSTAGLSLTLPDSTHVSPGEDILFVNSGGNTLILLDQDGGTVATIDAGENVYIYLKDNDSVAGVWGVVQFGVGASNVQASLLAGLGLQASGTTLQLRFPYKNVSGNYSVVAADRAKLLDINSGSIVVTMIQASVAGDGFFVLFHNSSAATVDLDGFGSEVIDGSLIKSLAPSESLIAICNGVNWRTVGYGRDVAFVFSEFVVNMAAGDVALTSSQLSGKMIRLTGTAAANMVVTLPAVDAIYFINVEAGLGGYSATFTTGGGSSYVAAANAKTILYSDGTNVSLAITTSLVSEISLNDGSAAAPPLAFDLDPNTGIYRVGDGEIGFTSNGTLVGVIGPLGYDGSIVFVPTGALSATTVAGALAELDTDLTNHLNDAVDAHDASAISVVPFSTISATDVQAALQEIFTEAGATGPITATGLTVSAADKVLGRVTAGVGAIEEITCTAAGRALIDDANAAAQRTTLGLVIGTDVQAYDVNTVKKNVANTFSKVQAPFAGTSAVSTTSTFSFNPDTHGQTCEITLTNAITVTLAVAAGTLVTGTPYTLIFKAGDTSVRSFAKGATVLAPSAILPITSGTITSGSRDVFHCVAVDANTLMVVGSSGDVR